MVDRLGARPHGPPPPGRGGAVLRAGPPALGQCYATEAGRALVGYAFETLGLARIAYGVDGANTRSVGVMRRLGFRLERNLHPDGAGAVVGVLDNDRA